MSGQARRSRARTLHRWRKQAARLIVSCGAVQHQQGRPAIVEAIAVQWSAPFDVAAVRAHCERIIADADRRAAERVVFEDWTRDFGLGPDHGGWPGDLAHTWGDLPGGCNRDAAAGPGIANTARRLLDTLDGRCPWAPSADWQRSECRACDGDGGHDDHGPGGEQTDQWFTCDTCNGTGHNLRGVLPEIEWSTAIRRTYYDSLHHAPATPDRPGSGRVRNADWLAGLRPSWSLPDAGLSVNPDSVGAVTRVVPRGQHRDLGNLESFRSATPEQRQTQRAVGLVTLITRIGLTHDAHVWAREYLRQVPAWRRGELQHAAQRRDRAAARLSRASRQAQVYGGSALELRLDDMDVLAGRIAAGHPLPVALGDFHETTPNDPIGTVISIDGDMAQVAIHLP